MNDFKIGLIKDDESLQRDAFWNKYKLLNTITPEENIDLYFKKQIEQLRALENNNRYDYSSINAFLRNVNSMNENSIETDILSMTENQIYGRLIQILNSGFKSSELNPGRLKTLQQKNDQIDALIAEATSLMSNLDTLSEGFQDKYIALLDSRLRSLNFNNKEARENYTRDKAALVEEMHTEIFRSHFSGRTFTTGSWLYKGEQLIEDVITENVNIDIFGRGSATINGKPILIDSLKEFYDALENTSYTASVTVDTSLYNMIQKSKAIMGQTKSGMNNQPILNAKSAVRNALTLKDISFSPKEIYDLYAAEPFGPSYFKESKEQYSKSLAAFANWALSKSIAKTNIKRNQVYLSEHGFQKASEWLETSQQMLQFNPAITKIENNFMNIKRPYSFVNV